MKQNFRQRPRANPFASNPLRFSFRYLDTNNPAFDLRSRNAEYFRRLLSRLRDLSQLRVEEFASTRSATLRIHPIDFTDPRVAVRSFGIPNRGDLDDAGFQFAVSANEHGRVHGFLSEDTFYVRWLDPDHNLYPGG